MPVTRALRLVWLAVFAAVLVASDLALPPLVKQHPPE